VSHVEARSPLAFSATADAYATTMAPALEPVAAEVVRRAVLRPGEAVLDAGTGTGNAARLAVGDGRRVVGVDAAPGMLDIARRSSSDVELVRADFGRLPFDGATFDVVVSVHALLFAADRVAALREWRRVVSSGGRLSLSVPGPAAVTPQAVFGHVYERYGVGGRSDDFPDAATMADWAAQAGWGDVETDSDPAAVIELAGPEAFRTWLRIGRTRSRWSRERLEAFAMDLMDACPRAPGGAFRIPFGALYLHARKDA